MKTEEKNEVSKFINKVAIRKALLPENPKSIVPSDIYAFMSVACPYFLYQYLVLETAKLLDTYKGPITSYKGYIWTICPTNNKVYPYPKRKCYMPKEWKGLIGTQGIFRTHEDAVACIQYLKPIKDELDIFKK